jgi:uncharacterized protein YkwD
MLTLFNLERVDRGLAPLNLDSTLMSQTARNHNGEEAQYGYIDHPSPITQPGDAGAIHAANCAALA